MGQMLALKAAAQDVQGGEALRDFYASGGNAGTPEGARALMAANPKMGMQILKGQSEMSARDVETQAKSLKTIKDNVGSVNSQEGMIEYLRGAYSTPGGALLAKLVPLDKAIAAIPSDPKALAEYKRNFGSTADRLFESADAQLSSRTSLATAGMAANTAANRLAFEKQKGKTIAGEGQFFREDAYGNLFPVQGFGAQFGPDAPPPVAPPMPQGAANAFVTAARPSVNGLLPTAQPQGAGPTVAAAAAMDAQKNVPRPKVPIRQPVAIIGPDGKSVLVPPEQAVGKQPATAFAESTAEKKAQLNRDISTAIRNLELVVKPGGLLEKSTGSGLGRLYDASKGFFGGSTEGAIAGAQLAPIADMVLKMVPRFEGPQSNKDVDSYLAAAGKLADTGLPNDIRKGAAEIILKLMKERKGQFEIKGESSGGGASPSSTGDIATDPAIQSLLNKYK
jgi:hypothetical protein